MDLSRQIPKKLVLKSFSQTIEHHADGDGLCIMSVDISTENLGGTTVLSGSPS